MTPPDGLFDDGLVAAAGLAQQGMQGMAQPMLDAADIARLARDPSTANRAETAEKVAAAYGSGQLSPTERVQAEAIFEVLVRDAEVLVRKRLADSLKYNPEIPHKVAQSLAFDLVEVAEPILRHSVVLKDEDLVAVVGRASVQHARVVAARAYLSGEVASALVATNDEQVVETLLENRDAVITEPTYHLIADAFGGVPRIMDSMSLRAALPFGVVERIVTAVSEAARLRLVQHYGLDPQHVERLMVHAREHLLLANAIAGLEGPALDQAVARLYDEERLTPTIVLRALCLGEFGFAAAAMARFASIPADKARRLLLDPSRNGSHQLYDQSRLPVSFRALYRGVLALARWYAYSGKPRQRGPFRNRVHQWGAETLGIAPTSVGFEQLVTKLLVTAADGRDTAGQFAWKPPGRQG